MSESSEIIGNIKEVMDNVADVIKEATNTESIEIVQPTNPTDPKVIFDPSFGFSPIVVPYYPSDNDPKVESVGQGKLSQNPLKIDAIRIPLIKLNNKVIQQNFILDFILSFSEFLPKIHLVIDDLNGQIQSSDVPGMDNIITVVLTSPVEGASKKITLDFYITSCIFNPDRTIIYDGEFKLIGLKQIKTTQIGKEELNTYSFLEAIAKDLKLGFAATDKCKDIEDKRWRQIYGKTYIDFITEEISHSGLDEDSIFDTWIDPFGYLVLVNISFVMNEKIDVKQLTTTIVEGITTTESKDILPEQNVKEVLRLITNSNAFRTPVNLIISKYNSVVNTEKLIDDGTLNGYYFLASPGDENIIQFKQIQVVENSLDGIKGVDDYKYEKYEFIGVEQEETIPKLIQEKIRSNYLNKLYTKQLEVYLNTPNYKLERGTLIQVLLFEFDSANKRNIMNNYKNSFETDTKFEPIPPSSNGDIDTVLDENSSLPNPSLSGLYYIKEIEFIYHDGYENIQQKLVLVKRGIQNNLVNKYSPAKYYPQYK